MEVTTTKAVLDICVCNPVTDKFTTFEIIIQTSNLAFNLKSSKTRRRYNDFCWLRKVLKAHHPMCSAPDLPKKKKSSERFEVQFLVQRMKELGDWIYRLVDEDLYLSDTSVHLFLQSNLTCKQIDQYLQGNLSSSAVAKAYRQCEVKQDSKHTSTSVVPSVGLESSTSLQIRTARHSISNTTERSDSGFASGYNATESDSEVDSSSCESQSSCLSSYDSSINSLYPPVSQLYCQSNINSQSEKSGENCDNYYSTSHQSGHGGNHVTGTHEVKGETSALCDIKKEVACFDKNSSNSIIDINSIACGANQEIDITTRQGKAGEIIITKEEANVQFSKHSHRVEGGILFTME